MDGFKKEDAEEFKRPRTSEDFYLFCTYVLEYENYNAQKSEELRNNINHSLPLDSSRSSDNSESNSDTISINQDFKESGGESDEASNSHVSHDSHDSHDLITCYCQKPFAGRPMIECSRCLTWVHLSCARIKKTNIPEVFHCAMCKGDERKRDASPVPFKNKRHKKTS